MSIKSGVWIKQMSREQKLIDPFEEKLVRAVDDPRIISCGLSGYGCDCRLAPDEFKVFSPVRYTNVQARVTLQRRHYERGIGRGCYTE